MNYPVYITHELIMDVTMPCQRRKIRQCLKNFDNVKSIKKPNFGSLVFIEGTIHLYGYKIAGEGYYSGFFDVINQQFYTRDNIKNATIIEHESEYIYDSPIKPKKLRK